MRYATLIAAALMLLATGSASAQTTGTISGTVTALAGGAPIASAGVTLFDASRVAVLGAQTNASGVYTLSGLAPGTYYLLLSKTGFVPQMYNGVPCATQSCFNRTSGIGVAATPVTVAAGATTTVNVALDTGATISGTVRRSVDGTAISGETVEIYDSGSSQLSSSFTTLTKSDGTYSVTGIPFGTYYARTQKDTFLSPAPDYLDELFGGIVCPGTFGAPRCRIDIGTPIVVSPGTPSATADFSLPPAGRISGHVYENGRPLLGFGLYPVAVYSGSTLAALATTDGFGNYVVSDLDPGTYFVRTNGASTASMFADVWYQGVCAVCPGAHPTPVVVSSGATASSIDLAVTLAPGISGSMTLPGLSTISGGARVPDILIYAADGTLAHTLAAPFMPAPVGDTVQWQANGLPPGTYYVRTSSTSFPPQTTMAGLFPGSGYWIDELYDNKTCVAADCDPRLGTPVIVKQGATTSGINFTLDFGAQISGTVQPFAAYGVPFVQVFDSRGVRLSQRSGVLLNAVSNRYDVFGLPAGTYYLLAQSEHVDLADIPGTLYPNIPCNGCSVTSGTPVVVGLGERKTGIDFTVNAFRTVSGTVRSDPASNPPNQLLSTITVEAYAPNGQLEGSALTLANGAYTIARLDPGTYYLRTRNARGFIDSVYNGHPCGRCDPLSGDAVVVPTATDVTGIDFTLSQAETVSGQVLAADGSPLASAGVVFYSSSPSSPAARATTDSFGGYLATLAAGAYFVQTDPIAGYAQQIYNGVGCPQGVCPTGSATQVSVASAPVVNVNFSLPTCSSAAIAPVSLANAAAGIVYRQTLLATGASGAIGFIVSSGTLPPGLSLDRNTGVLSGTPTTSGQFTFTVSAVDSVGCAGARSYTLDVPGCTFPGPSLLSVPSAGVASPDASTGTLILQSCEDPSWRAAIDVPWMRGGKLPFFHPAPDGTLLHSAVGFAVDPNTSPASRTGHVIYGSHVLTVLQSGTAASPPFGFIDAPHDGDVVTGSIAVGGWALDDVSVSQVQIYRDPVAGEPLQPIFIGNATFVNGSRPDVETAFPTTPFNTRAGWGYLLLTNMLPNQGNGTFRLSVFAEDADLNRTLIGTKIINAVNASATAPFGAIDTPDQGGVASGSQFVNFGWALTPRPKLIPFDGSTINVLIDGVNVGNVTAYNLFRSDVSGLFPGLKNSGGPVGYRMIDTTALSEGTHTIAWLATDDGGSTTGIGSRYFTVQNSAWQPSLRANFAAVPPAVSVSELALADATTTVPPRVDGADLGRTETSLASLPLDRGGSRTMTMSGLQSLELSLVAGSKDQASDSRVASDAVGRVFRPGENTCAETYAGYLVVNGELRALPVGSSLDPAGTFYWHPGPGFFGTYRLLFVRTSCDGGHQRIAVSVRIR